mmetsp:Transcript_24310/g.50862  ORF Transcript_24310/g.50862 Transcript_24310/m.50862 type:complete len:212 (-) Transcript_24310:4-639(-)
MQLVILSGMEISRFSPRDSSVMKPEIDFRLRMSPYQTLSSRSRFVWPCEDMHFLSDRYISSQNIFETRMSWSPGQLKHSCIEDMRLTYSWLSSCEDQNSNGLLFGPAIFQVSTLISSDVRKSSLGPAGAALCRSDSKHEGADILRSTVINRDRGLKQYRFWLGKLVEKSSSSSRKSCWSKLEHDLLKGKFGLLRSDSLRFMFECGGKHVHY